jgi:hypothetical protein
MENRGTFYDHLVYLTAIGKVLWPLGTFCVRSVQYSRVTIKIWQPWPPLASV